MAKTGASTRGGPALRQSVRIKSATATVKANEKSTANKAKPATSKSTKAKGTTASPKSTSVKPTSAKSAAGNTKSSNSVKPKAASDKESAAPKSTTTSSKTTKSQAASASIKLSKVNTDLVLTAIEELNVKKGSTITDVYKFIKARYEKNTPDEKEVRSQLRKILDAEAKKGTLTRIPPAGRSGVERYQIPSKDGSPSKTTSASTKSSAATKPTTKSVTKSAAPKATSAAAKKNTSVKPKSPPASTRKTTLKKKASPAPTKTKTAAVSQRSSRGLARAKVAPAKKDLKKAPTGGKRGTKNAVAVSG